MWIVSFRVNLGVMLVFLTLWPAYLLIGLGTVNASSILTHIGGAFGIATALLAWYVSFAETLHNTIGRESHAAGAVRGQGRRRAAAPMAEYEPVERAHDRPATRETPRCTIAVEEHSAPGTRRHRRSQIRRSCAGPRAASAVRGEVRFSPGSRALYANDSSVYRQVPLGVVIPRGDRRRDRDGATSAARTPSADLRPRLRDGPGGPDGQRRRGRSTSRST